MMRFMVLFNKWDILCCMADPSSEAFLWSCLIGDTVLLWQNQGCLFLLNVQGLDCFVHFTLLLTSAYNVSCLLFTVSKRARRK